MASYLYFLLPLENIEGFFERLKDILRQGRQVEETPTQLRIISPTQACLLTCELQKADWVKFEAQGLAKQCKDRQARATIETLPTRVEMWSVLEVQPILETIRHTEKIAIFDCQKRIFIHL
jgi:hypothetical protein